MELSDYDRGYRDGHKAARTLPLPPSNAFVPCGCAGPVSRTGKLGEQRDPCPRRARLFVNGLSCCAQHYMEAEEAGCVWGVSVQPEKPYSEDE